MQTDVDVSLKQSPETDGKIICWPKEKKRANLTSYLIAPISREEYEEFSAAPGTAEASS